MPRQTSRHAGRALFVLLASMGAAALSGCAVGPNFVRPSAPAQTGYTPDAISGTASVQAPIAGGAQTLTPGAVVPADWWTLFHSPELDALVAQALAHNSDLAATQAVLKAARENWLAQRGVLFPTVEAGVSTSRNKSSQYLAPVPNDTIFTYSLQTAQVNVGYTLDLFGGNRRSVEQARAQYDAQAFQTEAARITLINTVAATAFTEAALRRQVEAQTSSIALAKQQLAVMRNAEQIGENSGADVESAEAALDQARAALPPLQKALAQSQDLLAYLTGHSPADGAIRGIDFAHLALPRNLPLSLPADLVRARPDVRAAEENLHAASAAVGIATAARLPNITISANAGGSSSNWSNLLSSLNSAWTVGGGITQPIFAGGSLLHRQRAARAGLEQANALYRSAVLTAFQNVADTLHALQVDADGLSAAQAALSSAQRSLTITQRQYAQGQVSFVSVLAAEQTLRSAEQGAAQAQAARLTDTAALFQALGGGWHSAAG